MRLTIRAAATACAAAVLISLGMIALVAPPTGAAATAEGKDYSADLRQITKKLDEVLAGQKALEAKIETQHAAVMEEMRVIKVRTFQSKPR